MFASPSSSSSSDRERVDPIEAALRGRARRARRIRPVEGEVTPYTAVDPLLTDLIEGKNVVSKPGTSAGRKPIIGESNQHGIGKSRYIEKLVVSAQDRKARAEELAHRRVEEQRQVHSTAFPESGRFVTKSYKAALQRRAEAEREARAKAATKSNNLLTPASSAHAAALRFAAADAAATVHQNSLKVASSELKGLDQETVDSPYKREAEKHAASQSILGSPEQVGATHIDNYREGTKRDEENHHPNSTTSNSQIGNLESHIDPEAVKVPKGKDNIDSHVGSELKSSSMRPKKKRGLRRNDAKSIEAYRQRYLQRKSKWMQTVK